MFDISFAPDSLPELTGKKLVNLGRTGEMDLRYGYFEMDLSITTDEFGRELIPGTPVLDFVFCLLLAARDVQQGDSGCISFTENDLLIHFTCEGDTVTVTRSWDSVSGYCKIDEFLTVASRFSRESLEVIVQNYPVFQENQTYRKLVDMVTELMPGR
ncbi:hypothetical protein [Streptomyces sp. SID12501]|uniref:Uncharacterized protein n=1 Tax=Streptomyces sp. SID12501 TaxID=2706042 RepID=A0A6B3BIS9_9ACTN|nr:hypothetical protein [Streptomyces sp. SID12501]NEC85670.1 hypothetical protein [Streptomyces sp. SID12501]